MGPITAPEWELRRKEGRINPGLGPVDDIWSKIDVCWGIWSGLVLVQDIWSGLASVEDVNDPTKVPGGQQPCGCIGDR